jgi:predicted HTH transcriptional regulator
MGDGGEDLHAWQFRGGQRPEVLENLFGSRTGLRQGDPVTNASYRQISGLDSRIATRELGELIERRLVEQSGTGRWTT